MSGSTSLPVRVHRDPSWTFRHGLCSEIMREGLRARAHLEISNRARKLMMLCALGFGALAVGGCGGGHVLAKTVMPCRSDVENGVLPAWARGGFSDPRPRLPHVVGASADIVAILWGSPLTSPPRGHVSNKILWVSRVATDPGSNLRIAAQRMAGSRSLGGPVARVVTGGPGPSIVNLPSPGCWRLTLRWSGRIDSLDLQYHARPTT
jgi:hypothetical protein